jgi:probable rRNA maturation factor
MMTCETTTPHGRGEHANGDDGTAGTDDAGPSRSTESCTTGEAGEPPDARGPALDISIARGVGGFDQAVYHALSERVVGEASRGVCAGGLVRVRLVGDAEMSSAHEQFCGVRGTTDVITFDLAEGESARGTSLDVDLIICVDEARRHAANRKHSIETELALYTLHGVLHALGYDDLDDASYERMHAREDDVFRALGLGAAFGRGEQA